MTRKPDDGRGTALAAAGRYRDKDDAPEGR